MHITKIKLIESIHEENVANLMDIIEDNLMTHKPTNIVRGEDLIEFESSLFRMVSNWNLLVPFSRGIIKFNKVTSSLEYSLSSKELMLLSIFATVFLTTVSLIAEGAKVSSFLAPVILWGVIFALNYMIGINRFHSFICHCIHESDYKIHRSKS